MDYYKGIIHFFYLMKQLKVLGRLEIFDGLSDSVVAAEGDLNFDTLYDAANRVISEIFDTCAIYYNEDKEIVTCVLTDEVISEYYQLSDKYGKRFGLSGERNPYFKVAEKEGGRCFNFSYNIGWFLEHRPESRSPFKTKLVLLWQEYGDFEMMGLAIGVTSMYQFFNEKSAELKSLLSEREAIAA